MPNIITITYTNTTPNISRINGGALSSLQDTFIKVVVNEYWNNITLFLLFKSKSGLKYKVLYDSVNGTAIPNELTTMVGIHELSLYGVDSQNAAHTINSKPIQIQILDSVEPNGAATDSTPSELQQIESQFADVIQQSETNKNEAASSAQAASTSAQNASNSETLSESWAVGGTGTRTGEDANNSYYFAQQSQTVLNTMNQKAENGDFDGFSPSATVQQTENGATITITDKSGITTAVVTNGSSFVVLGYYDTLSLLQQNVPTPNIGDNYGVGTSSPYDIYTFDGVTNSWKNNGNLKGLSAYLYIRYGETNTPNPLLTQPNIYIGICSTNNSTAPTSYTDYVWYKWKGETGVGISSITRTSGTGAAGTTDTYTITYTDASTSTFTVVNGSNGTNGADGSDATVTKAAVEAVLTGNITSHTHSQYLTEHQDISGKADLNTSLKLTADQASASIVAVTASKTLALIDAGTFQQCSNSSAITITIPTNTSIAFSVGCEIEFCRYGAGTITFSGASGVTLSSADGAVTIASQYGCASLKKLASDTWLLVGGIG